MILELDCGNSLIKWRVVQVGGERLVVEGAVDSAQALLQVLREQQAREYWRGDFEVFLTGGDAVLVCDMLPEARWAPDLVFVGRAIACPLS